ncbi:hypothetical protein NA57DRAFT_53925 [Rhizodiscina lignyota]|uniref:Uncharacterized protein n=1 Tax=Rhizodiscina lignyota TaxID=1504668 RepID=A0A9P4IMJ8_9PEZI|nr:hypothetical protein NA57DRAFT_53925 [Rhizodiscina lignyota]
MWTSGITTIPPISNDVYAARLGLQLNTYWGLINGMYAIPGGISPTTAIMAGTNVSDYTGVNSGLYFLANSSTSVGTQTTSTSVIQAHYGWIVALSVSITSIVMIIATLVPPIIRYTCTRSPDVMQYLQFGD